MNGLLTMMPLGAAMALAFWDNPVRNRVFEPDITGWWHRFLRAWERITLGGIRGAIAASIAYAIYGFAIYAISKGHASPLLVRSVWGWWFLVGLGVGLSYGYGTRYTALVPIRGLLLLAVVLASVLHQDPPLDDARIPIAPIIRSALQHALAGPDLPAGFWIRVRGRENTAHDEAWPEAKESQSEKNSVHPNFLYRWFGCSTQPGPSDRQTGKDHLCGQLVGGLSSPFVRSWLVVLFFAAGLGLAGDWETRLRPTNYQFHSLYKVDQRIAGGIILTLVTTVVLLAIQ